MELEDLYNDCVSKCTGCSILDQNKPFHAMMDYINAKEVDVLFLSDSYRWDGEAVPLKEEEHDILTRFAQPFLGGFSWTVMVSVKCPGVRDMDMKSATNMAACRQHLAETIEQVKPKLIFPMGNLAMRMLIKKSGVTNKRGSQYIYTTESGHETIVVPIYHPFVLIKEPRHVQLFQQDIKVAVDKYLKGEVEEMPLDYTIVSDTRTLQDYEFLYSTDQDIGVDIETTGLDFLTDKMLTVAFAWRHDGKYKQIVIPYDHFEVSWDSEDKARIIYFLDNVMGNENNRKVLQNAKFDLHFLIREGVMSFKNIWDTKTLAHLDDENQPKGLIDLVKKYFPQYLEAM